MNTSFAKEQPDKDQSTAPEVRRIKISELQFDDRNANMGTEEGRELLQTSINKYGIGRGVLADKNLKLIAGNHAVKEMMEQGIEEVIVIPTNGKTLVVTQRVDIDKNSKAGNELAIADNRVSQANLNFDMSIIRELDAEFDLNLGDIGINLNEEGPYFQKPAFQPSVGAAEMETSYGEKSYDQTRHQYVQNLFPLAITLTKAEKLDFENWKREYGVRSDTDAFHLLFKKVR